MNLEETKREELEGLERELAYLNENDPGNPRAEEIALRVAELRAWWEGN